MSVLHNYVRYDDSIEVKQPDEDRLIANIVESMARVNLRTFEKHRHALRDAHAKSHGILKGALTVSPDLPDHLRQGLFRAPREYPMVVRFSTALADIHDDAVRSLKGMAIKVIGVEGRKLLRGQEDQLTQDFLLVNYPVIAFGHVAAYWDLQQKLEKHADDPELLQRLEAEAAAGIAGVLRTLGRPSEGLESVGASNHHILGETFHSMAAIRYGDHVAKISVAPLSDSVKRLTGEAVVTDGNPSAFRDRVAEFFRTETAEYELRAQLCTDLGKMPVEDASIEWPRDLSPCQAVAKLTFHPQDVYSPARRVCGDETLSFNPWHCIEEHRPLGSIMRARIQAYEKSTQFRHEMNVRPRVEPRDISEIPD